MTAGQAFQLVAVITQQLGKIGLGFDGAKVLIDKPSVTRRRLNALRGESPHLIVPHYQYATLERLDANPDDPHRYDTCGEYLTLDSRLEEALGQEALVHRYGSSETPRWVHRCDVVHPISEKDGALYPVFREAMMYYGSDDYMWDALHRRRALWTVDSVLGVVRDEIHNGYDPLILTGSDEDAVFPALLTEKDNPLDRFKNNPDRVGALIVSRRAPIRQKRGWHVSLSEGRHIPQYVRKLIFFANNPRPTGEK